MQWLESDYLFRYKVLNHEEILQSTGGPSPGYATPLNYLNLNLNLTTNPNLNLNLNTTFNPSLVSGCNENTGS